MQKVTTILSGTKKKKKSCELLWLLGMFPISQVTLFDTAALSARLFRETVITLYPTWNRTTYCGAGGGPTQTFFSHHRKTKRSVSPVLMGPKNYSWSQYAHAWLYSWSVHSRCKHSVMCASHILIPGLISSNSVTFINSYTDSHWQGNSLLNIS